MHHACAVKMRVVNFCYTFVLLVSVKCFEFSELGVEKCRFKDSKCMLASFQTAIPRFVKGIPEYGVEVMDEMVIDDIKFEITGFEFMLTNGRLKGDKDIVIDRIKFNTNNKILDMSYHVPLYILKGNYKTSGKLLTLPIEGDGDIELKLENVAVKSKLNYDIIKKDNKSYMTIKDSSYEFDIGNAHYHLTNLFKGNKELSDTIMKVLNDNSKELTVQFGKPILDLVAKKTYRNAKKFLAKSPLEDIAIVD